MAVKIRLRRMMQRNTVYVKSYKRYMIRQRNIIMVQMMVRY